MENARRRLPSAQFRIENVATQGTSAVTEVVAALERLDADPAIDVIVIARGGGSIEDLLPFSNEALVRAVAACRTPVVSAIGHETDSPLLDLVADVAASTPTDAAKRVVPDLIEQSRQLADLARRARRSIETRVDRERELMADLPSRLRTSVRRRLEGEAADVAALTSRSHRRAVGLVDAAAADLAHMRARVLTLSPQATLDRGYAVVQRADGAVVRDPAGVGAGERLRIRVAIGQFAAVVDPAHGTLDA